MPIKEVKHATKIIQFLVKQFGDQSQIFTPAHETTLNILTETLGLPVDQQNVVTSRALAALVMTDLLAIQLNNDHGFYQAAFIDIMLAAYSYYPQGTHELFDEQSQCLINIKKWTPVDQALLFTILTKAKSNPLVLRQANPILKSSLGFFRQS